MAENGAQPLTGATLSCTNCGQTISTPHICGAPRNINVLATTGGRP